MRLNILRDDISLSNLDGETIAQQPLSKTKGLLRECDKLRTKIRSMKGAGNDYKPELFKGLSKEIKKMTNITANVTNERKGVAWSMTPRLRNANILARYNGVIPSKVNGSWLIEDQVEIEGSAMYPSKVWVTGGLSKLKVELGINPDFIFNDLNLTSAQFMSILLHEVGHVWNGLYILSSIVLGHKLIELTMEQDDEGGFDPVIFKRLPNVSNDMKRAVTEAKSKKERIEKIKWITSLEVARTHNLNYYDDSNSEQLAQTFSARFGYAKELIEVDRVLIKMLPRDIPNVYRDPEIVTTVSYQTALGGLLSALKNGDVTNLHISAMMAFSREVRHSGDFRYQSFRRDQLNSMYQMVNRMRTLNLPKGELKKLIADYDEAKQFLTKIPKDDESFLVKVNVLFRAVTKSAISIYDFQSDINALIENDLFVEAQRLTL